jgi:hypothetical protein
MDANHLKALRERFGGPLSSSEKELLCDMQAFIDFGIRNGLSFASIVANLGHDVNGLLRYGFDLKAAGADAFLPKVKGYSKIDADSVGEPQEPIESA